MLAISEGSDHCHTTALLHRLHAIGSVDVSHCFCSGCIAVCTHSTSITAGTRAQAAGF